MFSGFTCFVKSLSKNALGSYWIMNAKIKP